MSYSTVAFNFYDYHPKLDDLTTEVINGLKGSPRTIAAKFFYDEEGSKLFDLICKTPEYYPTQTETNILRENIQEIASCIGIGCLLVEPGSGNSRKVRELFDAIQPHAYLPVDISKTYLRQEAKRLAEEYPWLEVHAICADFTAAVELPYQPKEPHRVAFFPGSSIGNFHPGEAIEFLTNIANMIGPKGGLLIGVDLKKDKKTLDAAYNDKQGYTAAFNKNLLERINRDAYANFIADQFRHHAFYNELKGRVEMHLVSETNQQVSIDGQDFHFAAGDSIHTECSYKYDISEFQTLAKQAGFVSKNVWVDDNDLFSLHYFEVK